MLRPFLGEQLARFIGHVCFLADSFQFVPLLLGHHRFFHGTLLCDVCFLAHLVDLFGLREIVVE